MDFNSFSQLTQDIFRINGYDSILTSEQIEKLFLLTNQMLEVNKAMNLTAIKDEQGIILRHYVDSLTVSEYIPENSSIADIGCGAGFPSLPLAVFRPDLKILAVDSTAKRINYVHQTANLLELDNLSALAIRAEDLGNDKNFREKFDVVTARAVASLPVLTELCLPLAKIGGKFISMKAAKANEELELSKNAIAKCGGSFADMHNKSLTSFDGVCENRYIIEISKIKSTPAEFPRHYSKISKKPL